MNLLYSEKKRAEELAGKRLICETAFDLETIKILKTQLHGLDIQQAWNTPALAATMTVGTGIYFYNQGDFWSSFPALKTSAERKKWGEKFETFLEEHKSLETFHFIESQPHNRFLMPILAHGGIPQNCLNDFFTLITRYGYPDQTSSDIIDFLAHHRNKMTDIDKPVQRFLLYGGEVAEEFLARFLALWESCDREDGGGTFGLPGRVVKEFTQWHKKNKPVRSKRAPRIPQPVHKFAPGGMGVYLYLPECDNHPEVAANELWDIQGKKWAVTRSHEIPLSAERDWIIKFKNQEKTIKGIGADTPLLFFDPCNGKAIVDPKRRRLPLNLWVVCQNEMVFNPVPFAIEQLSGHPNLNVAAFNLEGYDHLQAGKSCFEVRRPFFISEADPVIRGVKTLNNISVFHKAPSIRWAGKANLSLSVNGKSQGNIDIESDELACLLDRPGIYKIQLRGPLGENVNKHFALVPGITIKPKPEIMWPRTKKINWAIHANNFKILSRDGDAPPFTSSEPEFHFQIVIEGIRLDLVSQIPQLKWRVISHELSTFKMGTDPISINVEELDQSVYPRLICDLGDSAMELTISLSSKHGFIQPPKGKPSLISERKVWNFDLRRSRDEVISTGKAEKFHLVVKGEKGTEIFNGKVLTVTPHWDIKNLKGKWTEGEKGETFCIDWEGRGNPVRGRWIGLLPLWRPWEKPVLEHELEESEKNSFVSQISQQEIKPGRYLLKAVHSPWGRPVWADAETAACKTVEIDRPSWKETFETSSIKLTVKNYFESLLAYWYCREKTVDLPVSPEGLSAENILWFLNQIKSANEMEPLQIPRDESGSLNIFLKNPKAATEAVLPIKPEKMYYLWPKILPSREIILLDPCLADREFLHEIAFQYTLLRNPECQKEIKLKFKQYKLSEALRVWHKKLKNKQPPAAEVIFLCERHKIFENSSPGYKNEYEKLKNRYQGREAI